MNWYLVSKPEDFPTKPTYEQRMTMIQGLEIWLSDPTTPQNLTTDLYDERCEMMRLGLV